MPMTFPASGLAARPAVLPAVPCGWAAVGAFERLAVDGCAPGECGVLADGLAWPAAVCVAAGTGPAALTPHPEAARQPATAAVTSAMAGPGRRNREHCR
jgi:hypothetical protein